MKRSSHLRRLNSKFHQFHHIKDFGSSFRYDFNPFSRYATNPIKATIVYLLVECDDVTLFGVGASQA